MSPYGDLEWTFKLTQNEKKYHSKRLKVRDAYGSIEYNKASHMGLITHQYMIDCWIKKEESRLFY